MIVYTYNVNIEKFTDEKICRFLQGVKSESSVVNEDISELLFRRQYSQISKINALKKIIPCLHGKLRKYVELA